MDKQISMRSKMWIQLVGASFFVVITHYQRLLNYIVPDKVHVLSNGKIVRSGGKDLALELEKSGYAEYGEAAA